MCDKTNLKDTTMDKPNLVFFSVGSLPFTGNTISEKPLGGTETSVIHLANGLSKDYNVIVVCSCPSPGLYQDVIYLDISDISMLSNIVIDVAIVYKMMPHLFFANFKETYNPGKLIFWAHDYPMYTDYNPSFIDSAKLFDAIVCVSNDHRNALLTRFPLVIDEDKVFAITHGVDTELYKDRLEIKKNKNQFYYSSTPFRGLEILIELFPKIKEKVPDATLKICSSLEVYNIKDDTKYKYLYDKCKTIEGIDYVGGLKQKDLAKIAMESELMLYPSIFAETCCLSVLEAQTAGTPVICSDLGALKETVHKGCGVTIQGNPYKEKWQNEFIDTVVDVCNNKDSWDKMHMTCLEQDFSLELLVKNWKKLLSDLK